MTQALWYICFILFVYGKHIKEFFLATHMLFFFHMLFFDSQLFLSKRYVVTLKPNLTKSEFIKYLCKIVIFNQYTKMYSYDERREDPLTMSVYPSKEAYFYLVVVHLWILIYFLIHGNDIFLAVDNSNVINGISFLNAFYVIMFLKCLMWIILFNPQNNPIRQVLILSLLYRWGKP